MLIVASVIQLFHLTPYAVARSLASQQMGEDEQGQFHVQSFTSLYVQYRPEPHRAAVVFLDKVNRDKVTRHRKARIPILKTMAVLLNFRICLLCAS